MISKVSLAAAIVAAAFVAATVPGSATTVSSFAPLKSAAGQQSMVQQAHGWHRKCRWGLNGTHKHVPGVGRVQCICAKHDDKGHCVWI